MKFSITAAALFAVTSSCDAFAPVHHYGQQRSNTAAMKMSTRVDSSNLVKEALEISKKFGASSPEARLAWEAVEEVDASDNR
jgi:hypothetical protein